ncbi:MAG: hypothetical protein OXH52_09010 [Gammaproteobacteria bacterium]|nr:hypothetical protein [Gammaproteobacteria bacterium]
MKSILLGDLDAAIAPASHTPSTPLTHFSVAPTPDPYVPPPFHLVDGHLAAEVIFVKAPAAVGKSITAQYLSSTKNAPLLDLAAVPVGTGSLSGLLSEYAPDGRAAFHRGELPVIIDALDEGRLLSGEKSIEAFFASLVAFLQADRSSESSPKLILFGREESAEFSRLAVQVEDQEIATCTLGLDFFSESSASRLIDAYAQKELRRLESVRDITRADRNRREALLAGAPMREVKSAYFTAIEKALEVAPGDLWKDSQGRAFAGYAPVLASIGTLLASVENPLLLVSALRKTATRQAWDVIDAVIQQILQRERKKLVDKLAEFQRTPANAYAPSEQLTYLGQLITGRQQVLVSGSVRFENEIEANRYREKVSQMSAEHPFIRAGRMANDVLGSVILAHAVLQGDASGDDGYLPLLRDLAKGPFLWRSIRRELALQSSTELDGRFLGYITASYWSDPLEGIRGRQRLQARERADGFVAVSIGGAEEGVRFSALPPIALYGRMHHGEIDVRGAELLIEGATLSRGGTSSFRFEGDNRIRCGTLDYNVESTQLRGSLWLEASGVSVAVPEPEIRAVDCVYGWGGAIKGARPWKQLSREGLTNPYALSPVVELIADCRSNIPANGIVLLEDYSIPEGEGQLGWTRRHGRGFFRFMKLLVDRGHAERELVQSRRRENKYRIKLTNVPWHDLEAKGHGHSTGKGVASELLEATRRLLSD